MNGYLPHTDLTQTAIRQFRKLLDDHGLKLAAASYPTNRGYDDPQELDRRVQGTCRAMKAAAELGARVLVNRAFGDLPEPGQPRRDTLVQSLTAIGNEGNRVGARFAALTTACPAADLAQLLSETPEGTLGVSFHPANLLAGGQSPVEALVDLRPYVLHTHACDAVKEFGAGRTVEVDLGRGAADMPAILATLESYDYHGWVTVERTDSQDPVTDIGNAVAFLRSLES